MRYLDMIVVLLKLNILINPIFFFEKVNIAS